MEALQKAQMKEHTDVLHPAYSQNGTLWNTGKVGGTFERGANFEAIRLVCETRAHITWVFRGNKIIFCSYWLLRLAHLGFTKLREKHTLPFSITQCLFIRSLK